MRGNKVATKVIFFDGERYRKTTHQEIFIPGNFSEYGYLEG